MIVDVGNTAPNFRLPIDGGAELELSSLKGGKVVLYFYPKDSTPGCTLEAQDFRDNIKNFKNAGATIVGVSKDSVKRHNNFKAKHDLPFTLVADTEGEACRAYGVWVEKMNYGRKYMGIERSTFLIDEKGIISKVWRKVRVKGHAQAVLEVFQNNKGNPKDAEET